MFRADTVVHNAAVQLPCEGMFDDEVDHDFMKIGTLNGFGSGVANGR